MRASAPIGTWEYLLNTTFFEWNDSFNGKVYSRCASYSLPNERAANHIRAVFHTSQPPSMLARHGSISKLKQSSDVVTVPFLDQYYDIGSNFGSPLQSMSVFACGNEYFSPADLSAFQYEYGLTSQAASTVHGGAVYHLYCNPYTYNYCSEGNLDIQYIMGISQKTQGIYWLVRLC